MWKLRIVLWFVMLFVLFFSSVARGEYIAVLDFTGERLDDESKTVTSDSLRTSLHQHLGQQHQKYQLITRENLFLFLDDMGKDMSCTEGSCEVEIGRNIGADIIVSGYLSYFEDEQLYVINTKMFSTQSGTLIASFEEPANSQLQLIEQAKQIGFQIAQLLKEPLADIAVAEYDPFDALLRDLNQEVWAPEAPIRESILIACQNGDTLMCDWLEYRKQGSDLAAATGFFPTKCNDGDFLACLAAGWAYTQHPSDPGKPSNRAIDLRRGRNFIKRACKAGFVEACVEWGRLNAFGIGAVRSDFIALQRFQKACTEGSLRGCARLASLQIRKNNTLSEGILELRRTCTENEPLACHNLGLLYLNGQGMHASTEEGLEKIKDACNLGRMNACYDLGDFYLKGKFVKRNVKRASEFFRQGCQANHSKSCKALDVKWWQIRKWGL